MPYVETTRPSSVLHGLAIAACAVSAPVPGAALIYYRYRQLFEPMREITLRWCEGTLRRTGRTHLESREWDAFGHCWIACEGSRVWGEHITHSLGFCREVCRELGYLGPHDSLEQDLRNQALGRLLSRQYGRASELCDEAYRMGRLDLTAPITNRRFSLSRGYHTV